MKNKKKYFEENQVIQASDRQYRVWPDGSWRRIPKYAEVIGVPPTVEPIPFHVNLRDARTGVKCWCLECLKARREM